METERASLQKFSRKGWLCKTYEGELAMTTAPGVAPVIWDFSARDPKVIPQPSSRDRQANRHPLHRTPRRPHLVLRPAGYYADSVSIQQ